MKIFKIITGTLLCALLTTSIYADVTTVRPVKIKKGHVIEYVIVDNYDLGGDASTTKVYNEAEGTTFYDGAINVSGFTNIVYHVDLKTLGSTTVTLTFEAKIDDDFSAATGGHMLLFTKAFTATNANYSLPIVEGALTWVSVGMVSDDGGTDDITIKMRAERRKP